MAFDETGQADTVARKVEICERAYKLLTEQLDFDPAGHHLRPEHPRDRDRASKSTTTTPSTSSRRCSRSRRRARACNFSGGVSNLSFSFRGNDVVREAIHSAFLYHAINAGLDMGIVNAGQLIVYEDIPKDLLEHVEDIIFNRRPDATERMVEFAETVKGKGTKREIDLKLARRHRRSTRLSHALVHGMLDFLEPDLEEARAEVRAAARDHRRAADGRHEGRRRSVRRRQDVPAAGRQERPRHEEGGRVS